MKKSSEISAEAYERELAQAVRRLARSERAREEAERLLEERGRLLAARNAELQMREADLIRRMETDMGLLLAAQSVARFATFHATPDHSIIGSATLSDILGTSRTVSSIDDLRALYPELPIDRVIGALNKADTPNRLIRHDMLAITDAREQRWLRWAVSGSFVSGQGVAGVVQDITETKLAELRTAEISRQLAERVRELEQLSTSLEESRKQAELADQAKLRFLAMMSHDIRTPMNAILAMLEMLSVGELEDRQRRLVDLALSSGNQLLFLLADIIEVARMDGWTIELVPSPVNLRAHLGRIADSWRQLARKKGLAYELQIENDLPDHILLDPVRFRQLLDNLISNAIKYTLAGSVAVQAEMRAGQLRVSVTDSGIGIAPERQQTLFTDMQRIANPLSEDVEGTGLGLSICKRIVDAFGGDIGVESAEGQGCRFWFVLPLIEADPAEPDASALPANAPLMVNGRAPHFLVAEDVETNRIVMSVLLEELGCKWTMAENGEVAVELASAARFDAILMDVSMPLVDGKEATRRIRKMEAEKGLDRQPIIGVTAYVGDEDIRECREAGMDDVLHKPVGLAPLRTMLGAVLGQPSPAQPAAQELLDMERVRSQLVSVPLPRRAMLKDAIIADVRSWSAAFQQAVADGDEDAQSRARHALKGICEGFGAHALLAAINAPTEAGALEQVIDQTVAALAALEA